MRYPANIEGSKYGKNYRIGYAAHGYAFRIFGRSGAYRAQSRHDQQSLHASTLAEMSELLARTFVATGELAP